MTRDYTDFMNMTPNDLAQYARENASGNDLVQALADMLDAIVEECNGWEDRASELRVQVEELEDARNEWQGIAEQLNGVVKGLNR
jgi:chromosome segregation ATPase